MRRNQWVMAAALSAVLASSFSANVYAASKPMTGAYDEADDGGTGPVLDDGTDVQEEEISKEVLEDGVLEYREIGARIENYNTSYKETKTLYTSNYLSLDAGKELAKEASSLMEDAKDLKSDDMDAETRELYENYKDAAQALRKEAQSLTNDELPSAQQVSLRQMKNNLTKTVQNMMIQYQTALSQAELADKNVELAAAGAESSERKVQLGMSSQEEALEAQKNLYEAQNSAQQAHAGIENLRQNILILLGWDADSQVQIAPIPEPDMGRIAQMNLEQDKKAAVSANYDLRSIRSSSAVGAVARTSKKRNVSMTEQTVEMQVEKLYAEVTADKQAYDAAVSAFEAAQQTMDGAERQYSLGMIGKTEYLAAQISYLNARAAKDRASMELFKGMEDYDWAVKGLIVSNGG